MPIRMKKLGSGAVAHTWDSHPPTKYRGHCYEDAHKKDPLLLVKLPSRTWDHSMAVSINWGSFFWVS